jgi:thymidylate synthase
MDPEEIAIEERKLRIEEQKLEIEREKLKLEDRKAKWTTASVLTSVLVAGATIPFGAWSVQSTAKSQLQTETAKLMFTGDDSGTAVGKGLAMVDVLGDALPKDFQGKLLDNKWRTDYLKRYPSRDANYEQKIELIKTLAASPKKRRKIIENWCLMFHDDTWVEQSFGTANVPDACRPKK